MAVVPPGNLFRDLMVRMNFSNQAATMIVDQYNINSTEALLYYDDDQVERLCALIRKPGGRTAGARPQQGLGHDVSPGAEEALKLLVFYIQHMRNTSRIIDVPLITLAIVQSIRFFRDWVKNHKNTEDLPSLKGDDWNVILEDLGEYLSTYLGESGIPLLYVIRQQEDVPQGPDPSANYPNELAELARRAPIYQTDAVGAFILDGDGNKILTPVYKQDRQAVYNLLWKASEKLLCRVQIKTHHTTKDGRAAYFQLVSFYKGDGHLQQMATTAENKLQTMSGLRTPVPGTLRSILLPIRNSTR